MVTSDRWLDDDEVIAAASARGWRLVEEPAGTMAMWRWLRFSDELWPSFASREAAASWMHNRLIGQE